MIHVSDTSVNSLQQLLISAPDLSYGVIGGVGCLHALVPTDPNSDVCGLDHSYVVGTISNCQRDGIYMFLYHVYNFRFLQWRHSEKQKQICQSATVKLQIIHVFLM